MKGILSFTIIISLLLSPIAGNSRVLGKTAPNIYGKTLNGDFIRLSDLPAPMILNFFWVECIPCKEELPELARLEKEFTETTFVTVHVEHAKQEQIVEFLESVPAYPSNVILASPRVKDNYRGKRNSLPLPVTYIVNKDRKIIDVIYGFNFSGMQTLNQHLNKF